MFLAIQHHSNFAFKHIQEALCGCRGHGAAYGKFHGVLCKCCTNRRTGMNNGRGVAHARKGSAHKGVRRKQRVVRLPGTACVSKLLHRVLLPESIIRAAIKSTTELRALSAYSQLLRALTNFPVEAA